MNPSTNGDSAKVPLVSQVMIGETPDGKMYLSMSGIRNRGHFNQLIETAKQDILAKFAEIERQGNIEVPPPGLRIPRTG